MNNIKIIRTDEPFTTAQAHLWYANIPEEIRLAYMSAEDSAYFGEYYREAGMLRAWRRPFFMRHYAEPFVAAANFLMSKPSENERVIVDLGCGCGTQSIALAMMGAKVIGLDMDQRALKILLQRKQFYESKIGHALDIQVFDGDVFSFDYSALGPIDGVYSMFAFNMMQPTTKLLDLLSPRMAPGGRFVIQDGNRLSWLSLLPSRRRKVLTPLELERELLARGFAESFLRGAISLPPVVWNVLPRGSLIQLDDAMNSSWFWPISYSAMFEKRGEPAAV